MRLEGGSHGKPICIHPNKPWPDPSPSARCPSSLRSWDQPRRSGRQVPVGRTRCPTAASIAYDGASLTPMDTTSDHHRPIAMWSHCVWPSLKAIAANNGTIAP